MEEGPQLLDEMYKKAHEEFISNHNGTSVAETLLVNLNPILGVLLHAACMLLAVSKSYSLQLRLRVPLEFLITALPSLLSLTCCSDRWEAVLAFSSAVAVLLFFAARGSPFRSQRMLLPPIKFLQSPVEKAGGRTPYLTNYRSSLLFVTALCILAVDFPVFPRRFAKAETFGFGLMDVGVGSFVFSAGMLSLESRKGSGWLKRNRIEYLSKSLKEAVPMAVCGFIRLASVKASGYQEHVTEYGVHWNFFFTLAFTKVASSLVYLVGFPGRWSWTFSLAAISLHEVLLSLGAGEWVVGAPGDRAAMDLVSANREGIVSILGYLAIYFAGASWGIVLLQPKAVIGDFVPELKALGFWSLLMWASLFYSRDNLLIPPSRRLCNWSYFNWMVAFNLTLLLCFLTCDLLVAHFSMQLSRRLELEEKSSSWSRKGHKSKGLSKTTASLNDVRVPLVNQAIGANGLVYFLLANLFTGAMNFCLKTIYVDGCPAVLLLASYLVALQVVLVYLHQSNKSLKPAF